MTGTMTPFSIELRIKNLTQRVRDRYNLKEQQVHIGHLMLEALRGDPEYLHQIDAATDESHTSLEVAAYTIRLADAMNHSGLKTGDHVVLLGPNNIWLSLPFYACHYNGYASCTIDPCVPPRELEALFTNILPKLVFCSTKSEETVQKVLKAMNLKSRIVTFDGKYNLDVFIKEFNGNETGFIPAVFDTKETNALLILTSGTTGMPKVVVVPFETLYQNIASWWKDSQFRIESVLVVSSLQWLSSLIIFSSSPFMGWTRIQTSGELAPRHIREVINKFKPQLTGFAPYLLRQLLLQEADACDLSSLFAVTIAGAAVDNDVCQILKEKYGVRILVVYAMSESLGSPFRYVPNTPLGSLGVALPAYSYKLIDDDGNEISEPKKVGELWWKGGHFFKEYLNNPEETAKTLTPDGWLITGDLMSRDENNFYYFYERKKLLIKYKLLHVAPIEIEAIIKKHPKVSEAVVVGIPDPIYTQLSTAAIKTIDGSEVEPSEIFALVNEELPVHKRLHGGLFFVKDYPLTAAGKINRPAVLQQALQVKKFTDPNIN